MIRNEHERRVTERKLTELTEAADAKNREPMPDGRNPEMHQLALDGMLAQIAELQAELDIYTELAAGNVHVELPHLDELGDELVRARIAAGLSQRQLDEAAGLAEGVIRRYERESYNGASLHRLQLIQQTLHAASVHGFHGPQAQAAQAVTDQATMALARIALDELNPSQLAAFDALVHTGCTIGEAVDFVAKHTDHEAAELRDRVAGATRPFGAEGGCDPDSQRPGWQLGEVDDGQPNGGQR